MSVESFNHEIHEEKEPEPENFRKIQPETGMTSKEATEIWNERFKELTREAKGDTPSGENADTGKDSADTRENAAEVPEQGGESAKERAMAAVERGIAERFMERNPEASVSDKLNQYETKELPEDFRCINSDLAGQEHLETHVPFEKQTLVLGGRETEVVVPKFESRFDAQLPADLISASDAKQFSECTKQLADAVRYDPDLAQSFSDKQREQIENKTMPEGFTWHHDAEIGKMQLVDQDTHGATRHTGGRSIWGGGSDAR